MGHLWGMAVLLGLGWLGMGLEGSSEGERVSATFREVPVHEALMTLARQGGLNVVVAPEVKGKVTAFFHNIAPLQAIKALAEQVGAQVEEQEGVYVVKPRPPQEAPPKVPPSPPASQEGSLSPRVRVFHPQYQTPSTLARILGGYVVEDVGQPISPNRGPILGSLLQERQGERRVLFFPSGGGVYGYRQDVPSLPFLRLRFGERGGQSQLFFRPGSLSGWLGPLGLGFEFRQPP